MYKSVEVLEVLCWGRTVGALALDPATGFYAFEYHPKWNAAELSPLQMPISPKVYEFPDLPPLTYKRLPAMVADVLPDDFGNALINAYLGREGVLPDAITPLDRLAYVGNRGMGALTFKPATRRRSTKPTAVELSDLVTASRAALTGNLSSAELSHAALTSLIQVGTSAGGARAKAVIAWNNDTNEILSGQLDVPAGFEHWLIKFDGVGQDHELGNSKAYGRIEYAYYLMAIHSGITMAPCKLLLENDRAHFMTKRFDRDGNDRHHMQSLCAMSHMDFRMLGVHSYEQLLNTMEQLQLDETAMAEAYRRMCFNVIAANCDDHTKNHAFLLRQGGTWELSPAYDVTHAYNPNGRWTNRHPMSVNGKFENIGKADLFAVGETYMIPGYKDEYKAVLASVKEWPQFARVAGLDDIEIDRIAKDYKTLFPELL